LGKLTRNTEHGFDFEMGGGGSHNYIGSPQLHIAIYLHCFTSHFSLKSSVVVLLSHHMVSSVLICLLPQCVKDLQCHSEFVPGFSQRYKIILSIIH